MSSDKKKWNKTEKGNRKNMKITAMKVTKDVKELILEVTLVKMRFQIKFLRSSRPEVFYKKGVLRNFAKVTGKNLCQSLFIKKRLWHSCFPVNFAKFLRTPFLQNTSGGCFCKRKKNTPLHLFWFCSKIYAIVRSKSQN